MPTSKTYSPSHTAVLGCCEDIRHEEIHHRCEELFQALVHASLRTHFERLSSSETLYLVTGDGERVQISPKCTAPSPRWLAPLPTVKRCAWSVRIAS